MNVSVQNLPIEVKKYDTRKRVWKKIWEYRVLYLFMMPGILLYLIFSYAPMFGLVMVFQKYDPISGFFGSPWVGMENLQRIFSMPDFTRAFRNTIIISLLRLLVEFPFPIVLALMLNELGNMKFKKSVQTISYLPNFISWVIVAGIWYKLLSLDDGAVNQILIQLGIIKEGIMFMQSKEWFYPIILFTDLWKNAGFSCILYLSAIATIDVEQYEAAVVDGAGRFKQARYVTLPGMKSIIVLLFILAISGILNAGFDQLWTMGNIALRDIADILDTAVLRYLTGGSLSDLSIGAAIGFFKAVIALILFVAANLVSRALKQDSLI